jgi:hypothetical protein
MNTLNKWRFRGHKNNDKIRVIRSQNQHNPPTPTPTLPLRSYKICLVPKHILSIDNRTYELLNTFIDRLTKLEHYVYNTSDRLKKYQYRKNNLPNAETLWRQIHHGKVREFREGSSVSRNQTRIRTKSRRGYNREDQIESPRLPRTIDITQCRYCSS